MDYERFTQKLRRLFRELTPTYIGTAHAQAGDKIRVKADGTPVGNLDHHALNLIRNLVREEFPDDATIGEEDGKTEGQVGKFLSSGNAQWSIDGLDGTGNRRMGLHSYGAAIARRRGGTVLYAAAFRPADEALYGNGFYFARHGKGAWQWCGACGTYHRLRTAAPGQLERIVVMLEGSSKNFFRPPISPLGRKITTRPSCSSSIAATAVASGKASALVTAGNRPWDTWPAYRLIKEAGGIITDRNGGPVTPENCGSIIAAGNAADHAAILRHIKNGA